MDYTVVKRKRAQRPERLFHFYEDQLLRLQANPVFVEDGSGASLFTF
jgi:hypothetical protein